MCLPSRNRGNRLLLTRKSYECPPGYEGPPTVTSSLMTMAVIVVFLFAVEHAMRAMIRVSSTYSVHTHISIIISIFRFIIIVYPNFST